METLEEIGVRDDTIDLMNKNRDQIPNIPTLEILFGESKRSKFRNTKNAHRNIIRNLDVLSALLMKLAHKNAQVHIKHERESPRNRDSPRTPTKNEGSKTSRT